ncbi:opacity family porin [Neisseria lactamica]|uniref:Opa protein n=1 Tax=Neisseria lactamica TaxID=486 RepID=A0A378VJ57_NEILA|nr:opacity family porin [Neisseria lactamica]SUA16906.1 Opa protein [Neisseria lactamica]
MNPAPKKTLLFSSLLFSSLLFSSAAQAASEDNGRGPYVQADLTYASELISRDYPKATDTKFDKNIHTYSIHPRVSVGYDFGGWRIAADYARYRKWYNNKNSVQIKEINNVPPNRKDLKTENQENGTFHAISSLGLSAVYDFDTGSRFKPYAGVRVSYGHVRHSIDSTKKTTEVVTTAGSNGAADTVLPGASTQNAYHESHSIRRVGFGAVAGVGIDITPNLTLDTGYRYHYWGRLENTRFKTHEASLGVRYRF